MHTHDGDARLYSFPPLVGERPMLLLLGSMPSVQSLADRRYYAHPRNHFWPLMAAVLEEDLPEDYDARLGMLARHGVALWDSIGSCLREGSLDSAISQVSPNDIGALLAAHPSISAIACNGQKAHKELTRHHDIPRDVSVLILPSSSPVPRKGMVTLADKLPHWTALRAYTR